MTTKMKSLGAALLALGIGAVVFVPVKKGMVPEVLATPNPADIAVCQRNSDLYLFWIDPGTVDSITGVCNVILGSVARTYSGGLRADRVLEDGLQASCGFRIDHLSWGCCPKCRGWPNGCPPCKSLCNKYGNRWPGHESECLSLTP